MRLPAQFPHVSAYNPLMQAEVGCSLGLQTERACICFLSSCDASASCAVHTLCPLGFVGMLGMHARIFC